MKPFKVNRDSWHYKLNKKFMNPEGDDWYMEKRWEPQHRNFCSYWRSTIIRLVLVVLLLSVAVIIITSLVIGLFTYPIPVLTGIGSVIGIFGTAFSIAWFTIFNQDRAKARQESGIPDSLFVQKYKAYKSKICPAVEYNE